MADKIVFEKPINTSVQIGDELWYSDVSSGSPTNPSMLSTITDIGDNWVKIDIAPATSNLNLITNSDFDLSISSIFLDSLTLAI